MNTHAKILKLAMDSKLPNNISKANFPELDIFEELYDQGLIKAIDSSTLDGKAYLNPRITLQGRAYFENLKQNQNQSIFISCGQQTDDEKNLGKSIQALVRELTPFEPYFAEYQTSLEGLSKNIFGALNRSVGFIGVMHRRGRMSPPSDSFRASVWIEQEIAIAAFLHSALGKNLHVAAYIQPDITLEGVRKQLLLNPKVFNNNNEVLDHLRLILPTWQASTALDEKLSIHIEIEYEEITITQKRHDYRLAVLITNRGKEPLDDYHVDLEFPTALIEKPKEEYHYDGPRSSDKLSFFRATRQQIGLSIFPGDTLRVLMIPYYIDNDIYDNKRYLLKESVKAVIYSRGHEPISVVKSVSQLQIF
jgi:hypothetical protein